MSGLPRQSWSQVEVESGRSTGSSGSKMSTPLSDPFFSPHIHDPSLSRVSSLRASLCYGLLPHSGPHPSRGIYPPTTRFVVDGPKPL